jgi:predicted Zn-dependent peptidase
MKPKIKTLKNGLRIVTVPMKDNPTVTVLVMVEAGTRYETRETNGLSHFLEHMCFKGTVKRTSREISYELESLGAQTNAFTSYNFTGYYAKGRSDLFPKLVDVVSDVYLNSVFPEAEIEKERGVICGEIDMYEDMPQACARELLIESLYGDQPAGYVVLGPKENIKKFTRSDFIKYRDIHYVAGKTTIVVAGDIDSSSVEKLIAQAFKDIPVKAVVKKKRVNKKTGDRVVIKNKTTDQSHLTLGLRSLPMGHPDLVAFEVMVAVLGQGMSSRLFTKLREEMGAGYYVQAGNYSSDDDAEFDIATGTEPGRVTEVIGAIKEEVNKLRTVLVSKAELEKTKEYLVGGMYMGLESSDATAFHAAQFVVFHKPIKTPKIIEKEIRLVTPEQVQKAAKKYLKPEHFHLALIGPHSDKQLISEAFGA